MLTTDRRSFSSGLEPSLAHHWVLSENGVSACLGDGSWLLDSFGRSLSFQLWIPTSSFHHGLDSIQGK